MSVEVKAVHPERGLNSIQPGDVYEKDVFTPDELMMLRSCWTMQHGVIRDRAYRGIEVIRFVQRKKQKISCDLCRALIDCADAHLTALGVFCSPACAGEAED